MFHVIIDFFVILQSFPSKIKGFAEGVLLPRVANPLIFKGKPWKIMIFSKVSRNSRGRGWNSTQKRSYGLPGPVGSHQTQKYDVEWPTRALLYSPLWIFNSWSQLRSQNRFEKWCFWSETFIRCARDLQNDWAFVQVFDQKQHFWSRFCDRFALKVVPIDRAWKIDLIYGPIEFLERWFLINAQLEQKCDGLGKISLHS